MNRPIIYSLEQIRAFDTLNGWKDGLEGLAGLAQNMLSATATGVICATVASQTSSPSLTINLTQGWCYQQAAADTTTYGALSADATVIMQQGYAPAGSLTFTTAALAGGQSQWALVQTQCVQTDVIRTNDPNAGILPYINTANPNVPFQGPNNSGDAQNTEREEVMVFDIKYGTPATSGSEIPPSPDGGWLPYLLVDLTFGQTAITQGNILLASPAAYTGTGFPSGFPNAPYFPGVIGTVPGATSGSHHGGISGQANKINLNNGAEVSGIMAYFNLPVSNSTPNAIGVGGVVTVAQDLPVFGQCSGNPNGLVPGMQNDCLFNSSTGVLYVCTVSGIAAIAQWVGVGSGGISSYQNANFNVVGGNFTYLGDTAGGTLTATLPTALSMGGTGADFINIGSNPLVVTPQSGESINGGTVGASITILPGNGLSLASRSGTGWYTLSPQQQYQTIAKAASFTMGSLDPSGTIYAMTFSATQVATLRAATGSGNAFSFVLTPSSAIAAQATFAPNGSDTINNAGDICNNSGNPLFMPSFHAAPVTLVDYLPGQWLVL